MRRPLIASAKFTIFRSHLAAGCLCILSLSSCLPSSAFAKQEQLSKEESELVSAVEQHRIAAIEQVIASVVAIYDEGRQGGGSGVIIDSSGIALTNHHVIMGAGIEGWGGLADGKLYRWKLIGTDPGGDVSIIQMIPLEEGKRFPFSPLGDSDTVRVGDWALAMGNPFVLTEDQIPTVTLGIVSGVKRYQPGAGLNQLEYGNCIQVDSSINPGNSGGPLFNMRGEVIGINGRGSFKERGRVNVGLGYAISANQIKNFIPDLLATKLVEHATLDAVFAERDGKVVCTTINMDSTVAGKGLELGDELLEFEDTKIENANQFTNLICTIPEDWPVRLVVRKKDGASKTIFSRAFGLPYKKPKQPKGQKTGKNKEEQEKIKRMLQMINLLSADPGKVRQKNINQIYTKQIVAKWKADENTAKLEKPAVIHLKDTVYRDGQEVGEQSLWLASDGRFKVEWSVNGQPETSYVFDGETFYSISTKETKKLSLVAAKLALPVVQAVGMSAHFQAKPLNAFGSMMIHGSGKAQNKNAYRMELLDKEADRFFVWLQMYGDNGRPRHRLLKASADMDCEKEEGVVFDGWQEIGATVVPLKRRFVKGLAEQTTLEIRNSSATWLEAFDETLFKIEVAATNEADEKGDNQ